MGHKGTADMVAAGRGPREPTEREALAILRMANPAERGPPGARDLVCVENPCDRRHDKGCLLALDEGPRDEGACPGRCMYRDDAWREWGLL